MQTIFQDFPWKSIHSAYLVAGGDVMISRYIGYLNKQKGYDRIFTGENFDPIQQYSWCKSQNCLLFFNLESLFSKNDNDIVYGGAHFKANTKSIEVLKQIRKDHTLLLSLANNHVANAGYEGFVTTKELLDENKIFHIGNGLNTEERRTIYETTIDGIKLCFQAYSYDGRKNGSFVRNPLNETEMIEDLKTMKQSQCDAKIFSLHRGSEYKFMPNKQQEHLAHLLIDEGADLILGNHSHVPSKFETYKGKYIFYSFGNFIFDQERGKTSKDKGFDHIYDYRLQRETVPTYISLLAGFHLIKQGEKLSIILDTFTLDGQENGIHYPLDTETISWYLAKINHLSDNQN